MALLLRAGHVRALGFTGITAGLLGLGAASAAQLAVDGQEVVAGTTVVAECDSDGVAVSHAPEYGPIGPTTGYRLTEVVVGDLNDAGSSCGGTITVAVMDVSGNALATGSIGFPAAPSDQVTIVLSTPVPVTEVTGVSVAIG